MIVFDFGSEKKQSTYSDYLKTPEGGKFQLIGGEIIEMTSPSLYHQEILLNLVSEFRNFLLKNRVGKVFVAPSDVHFTDTETYQPDILILLTESFSKMQENKIEGAPDLIVEVLSPSTAYYDLKHKKTIYEKHGVKEYWVVDPIDKTVEIYQNQNAKFHLIAELTKTDTAKSQLIAGMEVELEKVF
jgi:Uma2 family endonuclease